MSQNFFPAPVAVMMMILVLNENPFFFELFIRA